ncbi:MAG: hypothetical protein RR687_10920 [Comamonas sp.]
MTQACGSHEAAPGCTTGSHRPQGFPNRHSDHRGVRQCHSSLAGNTISILEFRLLGLGHIRVPAFGNLARFLESNACALQRLTSLAACDQISNAYRSFGYGKRGLYSGGCNILSYTFDAARGRLAVQGSIEWL